ncbi:MAG: aconitate hydratase AcnA [Spirochaetaceae bacterium]|nr:aconitate hydratase AcnA [Spirochaetaceae bacterium]
MADPFAARDELRVDRDRYTYYRLAALAAHGAGDLDRLPYSLRILLESLLRGCADGAVTGGQVRELAAWQPRAERRPSLPYRPARVIMQDLTGVPAVVDLGAMRAAVARLGGDPSAVNPRAPMDLVIDHSVQVDHFGSADALSRNAAIEFRRNRERFEFLHWGQSAFANFRVVPPATGIVHQVNLEYLASVVMIDPHHAGSAAPLVYPDTLVGTDSHTTMINGLGVLGWGVGGIEAEAALLGQPYDMLAPDVVGVRLTGSRRPGTTATDVTLAVVEMLRTHGVVGKFVEFTGPGLTSMSLPDRATIANMAPEYGATIGFFPVDEETLRYLRLSGRSAAACNLVEAYCRAQGLFRAAGAPEPEFTELLELDIASVQPALAGPKRPQDRVVLPAVARQFRASLGAGKAERGFALSAAEQARTAAVRANGASSTIGHGAVVVAAITSCTNTSNPSVMLGAGILARKARDRGLAVPSWVKTSLAPGSTVVTDYLRRAGVLAPLAELGFDLVGYGCTTCIGNSGPLPEAVAAAIDDADLVVASVLSGNRNFEGRIHAQVKANFLASPPLVVAYALAGTVDRDLTSEPVGSGRDGAPVYLRDIWPTEAEIDDAVADAVRPEMFRERYGNVLGGNDAWNAIGAGGTAASELYGWDADSTYVREPPFFAELARAVPAIAPITGARALAMLGDSITTDHISPAGAIAPDSPAARYLREHGVGRIDFNTYGARRGNHEVMMRGTFANIRLKNALAGGKEGGYTVHLPSGEPMAIYDASVRYRSEGVPLVVFGGSEYGSGSSRDWAAKGPLLLGVRAVIVESFERIHRSNLVGMGVLPLEFLDGASAGSLGLTGRELFSIEGLDDGLRPRATLYVRATGDDGAEVARFPVRVRIDTDTEVDYYRHGGILHMVLRHMLAQQEQQEE